MTDKILLAETDRTAAISIARDLKKSGFDVVTASDATHVLALARKESPDVVVLNSQLAGSGVAVLRRIRSNVYTAHIPVVTIAPGARRAEMMAAGAQACVEQPVSAEALYACIQAHLKESLDFTVAPPEVIAAPERMAELRDTELLDSAKDESYDQLTRLTAKLLGAPVALVTLVDKDRQFFKSQSGLAEPWAGQRQTRLSHSFCQWVVSGKEALVVRDANEHPTLKKNLAIRDMGVVAYAGVPLSGRTGQAIGSFCAIDSSPRNWSVEDLDTIHDLARVTEAYASLDQARRQQAADPRRGPQDNLGISVQAGASTILAVSRIQRRYGARIGQAERGELLDIVERQAEHLLKCVSPPG